MTPSSIRFKWKKYFFNDIPTWFLSKCIKYIFLLVAFYILIQQQIPLMIKAISDIWGLKALQFNIFGNKLHFNPFIPNASFLYPLKTSENQR